MEMKWSWFIFWSIDSNTLPVEYRSTKLFQDANENHWNGILKVIFCVPLNTWKDDLMINTAKQSLNKLTANQLFKKKDFLMVCNGLIFMCVCRIVCIQTCWSWWRCWRNPQLWWGRRFSGSRFWPGLPVCGTSAGRGPSYTLTHCAHISSPFQQTSSLYFQMTLRTIAVG